MAAVTALLAPAAPSLVEGGAFVAEAVAKTAIGETAKAIWAKVRGPIEKKEAAREAMEDLAKNPDDADAQAVLRKQLGKIFEADPELASEVAAIVQTDNSRITVTSTGDGNIVVGKNTGAINLTNTVHKK